MVYLLKMVIFHGYVTNNQMVNTYKDTKKHMLQQQYQGILWWFQGEE